VSEVGALEIRIAVRGTESTAAAFGCLGAMLDAKTSAAHRAIEKNALQAICEIQQMSRRATEEFGVMDETVRLSVECEGNYIFNSLD